MGRGDDAKGERGEGARGWAKVVGKTGLAYVFTSQLVTRNLIYVPIDSTKGVLKISLHVSAGWGWPWFGLVWFCFVCRNSMGRQPKHEHNNMVTRRLTNHTHLSTTNHAR